MREITAYKTVFGMVALICVLALALLIAHPAQAQTPDEGDEILTWGNIEEATLENVPEGATDLEGTQFINRATGLRCRSEDNIRSPITCRPVDDPISRGMLEIMLGEWISHRDTNLFGCGISAMDTTVTVGQYICALGFFVDFTITTILVDDPESHYSYYHRWGYNSWHLSTSEVHQNYYEDGQPRSDAPANLYNPNNVQPPPEVPPKAPSPEVWEEEDDDGELVVENTVEAHNEATGSNNQGSDQYYPIEGGYIRKKNGKCFFNGHDGSYAVLNSCD